MQATIQYIKKELGNLYPESEIQGFIRLIFEKICGWNFTEQVLNKNEKLNTSQFKSIQKIVKRLKKYEPIQYVLGETEFMGLTLKVTRSVLIPRPETEELVRWIVNVNSKRSPRILDIGAGSGCISLALKNQIPDANVTGFDISENALEIAKINSIKNSLEVEFFTCDILKWTEFAWEKFDIIVSNPPYVRELEKVKMDKNVLAYEPDNALFVPDKNPLIFFIKIIEFAQKYLADNGKLFFEINEFLGDEMYNLLQSSGFVNIELKNDVHGKKRMISCEPLNED